MDGPGMEPGWTWDGLGRDPGGTRDRPWRDPGLTRVGQYDGPGMDITHLYLTILYSKETSDSLSLELQAYFFICLFRNHSVNFSLKCIFSYRYALTDPYDIRHESSSLGSPVYLCGIECSAWRYGAFWRFGDYQQLLGRPIRETINRKRFRTQSAWRIRDLRPCLRTQF